MNLLIMSLFTHTAHDIVTKHAFCCIWCQKRRVSFLTKLLIQQDLRQSLYNVIEGVIIKILFFLMIPKCYHIDHIQFFPSYSWNRYIVTWMMLMWLFFLKQIKNIPNFQWIFEPPTYIITHNPRKCKMSADVHCGVIQKHVKACQEYGLGINSSF